MKSIWTETTNIEKRQALDRNLETDVVVIGAGMAGVLTAYSLKKKGIGVVVLEAASLGDGQTKNTTAKITSQHDLIYAKLMSTLGRRKAEQYAGFNQQAIEDYSAIIEEEKIDCDFTRLPAYLYSQKEKDVLKWEAEAAGSLGINCQFLEETELPFEIKGALKFENQAQFHPLKFLEHLSQNIEIYEKTNVIKVEGNYAYTETFSVKAKHIVFATHYPFINRPGYFFVKMHQQRSYVLALKNAVKLEGMYFGIDKKTSLSLRNADDLLLLGGAVHRTGVIPKENSYEKLKQTAARLWPESEEASFWSAQDCMSIDGVPYIGRFSRKRPYWHVATGFQKWGMTHSMVAAKLLTEQILGRMKSKQTVFHPQRFKLSISLPTVFREGMNTVEQLMKGWAGQAPKCSHLGCGLEWNPYEKIWECPCHGSRFDEDGNLIDNPAQKDLQSE